MSIGICNKVVDAALGPGKTILSQVALFGCMASHIQIRPRGLCGVAILDFSGHVSRKGRYQTVSLVIFVYVCPILDIVPFKDDAEYLVVYKF